MNPFRRRQSAQPGYRIQAKVAEAIGHQIGGRQSLEPEANR